MNSLAPKGGAKLIFLSFGPFAEKANSYHQGSQFTADEFVQAVKDQGCKISMDRRGAWRDNIIVERLWKSVKYERVYLHAYDSVTEARGSIMQYIGWYNRSRPHSSLGKKTPDEAYTVMLPTVKMAA